MKSNAKNNQRNLRKTPNPKNWAKSHKWRGNPEFNKSNKIPKNVASIGEGGEGGLSSFDLDKEKKWEMWRTEINYQEWIRRRRRRKVKTGLWWNLKLSLSFLVSTVCEGGGGGCVCEQPKIVTTNHEWSAATRFHIWEESKPLSEKASHESSIILASVASRFPYLVVTFRRSSFTMLLNNI